jgi:hypothetical protein
MPADVAGVVIRPDGEQLAVLTLAPSLVLVGTLTLYPEHTWELPGRVVDASYHPGGEYLATANANGTVYILRVPHSGEDE